MGVSPSSQRFQLLLPFLSDEDEPPRILVLGCLGSGKTTLCRQLNRQTRSSTPVVEFYAHNIQNNVLNVWKSLKIACDELEINYSNLKDDFKVLYDFKHREKLSDKVVASLLAVSRTSLLEECQRKKRILPMPYNYKYFVQHTNRMIADGYLPTEADILYSYTPTIGLDGHVIRLGKSRYDVLELPGHRIFRTTMERLLPKYLCRRIPDRSLRTGHLKNKTINIFERLVQNELLNRVGFILLFNKKDAFEDMARGFDFKQLSSNLRSPQDALSYYRTVFMAASPPKRSYHHVISLINAPNLGLTLGDSLSRIFKHNTQATTIT
nr:Guanine nucleotide binding protein (G-protein) domain containing protein [Haemonchus contortus]